MPRLHLVTGHRVINRTDAPLLLYLGHDADQAKQAQDAAIAAGHALIAERYNPNGPVTRYGNKDSLRPLPTAEPLKPLIPVELGEGEGMTIVHVETEAEADFIKDLAASVEKSAIGLSRLQSAFQEKAALVTQLEADLQRETVYKAEVNQRIATLEADLKSAQEKLSAPATGPAQGDLLEPPSPPPKKKA